VEIFKALHQKLGANQVLLSEPMKNHTTFKVGGSADVFVMPQSTEELLLVLRACKDSQTPHFIIGNGSNLLVRDGGIRGVVISLSAMNEIRLLDGSKIHAQAGALMPDISRFACEHSLSGLEFAEGIPGSIGGGVVMNAGAYGGEMKDVFSTAQVIDKDYRMRDINLKTMNFAYRSSSVQEKGYIVCGITVQLSEGNKTEIAASMSDYRTRRQDKQPLSVPSAGSTFKRPMGHYAGKLIMDTGLRGFSIGGAQVSEKHCGFIVNAGNATADDVLALIGYVQGAVYAQFGVMLETEVKVVGE